MPDSLKIALPLIRLNPADNVAVVRERIDPALTPEIEGIRPQDEIPRGHKIAIAAIAKGEPVTKYGQTIGFATEDISAGQHVHTHNLSVGEFARDYAIGVKLWHPSWCPKRSELPSWVMPAPMGAWAPGIILP